MPARRYDIDWIRVMAIGLLLIYHTAIGFQPWGLFIGFITNQQSWESLWLPMTLLNVWRIPLLFFVAGMSLYLAMQKRNWKELIRERLTRIGIPLLFGSLVIVPLHIFLLQYFYKREPDYMPGPGHLWFLGNILVYVVVLSPLLFLLKKGMANGKFAFISKLFSTPFSLVLVMGLFIAEAEGVKPAIYELYAFTPHGWWLGMIAFFSGFLFMLAGPPFWNMLLKWRWVYLIVAIGLFIIRTRQQSVPHPLYLLSIESNCWIFTILAFACKYLNKNSKTLSFLKEAAYPVYIIHMVFLYIGAMLLFPLSISVYLKYALLLMCTVGGSVVCYILIIKPLPVLRVVFGLKTKEEVVNG